MSLGARARSLALGTARRTVLRGALLLLLSACSNAPDVVARARIPGEVLDPENPPKIVEVSGDIEVRDPAIIEANGRFYLFHTGTGIASKVSSDLSTWQAGPRVFDPYPAWIDEIIPDVGELWSPAIAHFGGVYHLYYAASVFGGNRSCIGHASKPALDSSDAWTDLGSVICSNTGSTADDWNAIDPELLLLDGIPWLVFGSYQSGIKLIRLDPSGSRTDSELYSVAERTGDTSAVQQPVLWQRAGYFYLFSSFDTCCRGVDSTHKIMVGRAADITGPYLDRAGAKLLDGGGTLVLDGDDRFHGPGSNALLAHGAKTYDVYHAYDGNLNGRATLRIAELAWDTEGWPVSGGP